MGFRDKRNHIPGSVNAWPYGGNSFLNLTDVSWPAVRLVLW